MHTPPAYQTEEMSDMPQHFQARIVGEVKHRVGDGATETLPQGQTVQVELAIASMVLSWESEGQPVTVSVAREEFLEYVDTGAIQIVN